MKPRTAIPKLSAKRKAALKGKPVYSTISSPKKAIRKRNPERQAKREKRYKAHLSSAYWKALRRRVWARMQDHAMPWSDPICECGCGQTMVSISEMQLAHLTYARFGHELDEDVQGQTKQCNQTEAALRGKRIVLAHN